MEKILFVVTSHSQLKDDQKTGVWLEEYAVPFMLWREAGYIIEVASPKGGQGPVDPNSMPDKGFCSPMFRDKMDEYSIEMGEAQTLLQQTLKLSDLSADSYAGVYYPGGHGCLWDVCTDEDSIALLNQFIKQDKLIFAICHASGILAAPKGVDNQSWINDRPVTGFSNAEENLLGLEFDIPFSVEDRLLEAGALYSCQKPGSTYIVRDKKLITGQNAISSWELAQAGLKLMNTTSD